LGQHREVLTGRRSIWKTTTLIRTDMAKTLEELVRTSDLPVFVDFWAEWCGPCRTIAPAVEQLARELSGRLIVVKVNVDRQADAAARFQVQGIPALLLFVRGELKWRTTGAIPYAQMKQEVLKAIG
jgi:thioredoxin 1/thioredoxin 2